MIVGFISNFRDAGTLKAQEQLAVSTANIYQGIKKLNVLGKVLYIGAHPDDENNKLIAYLSNELLLDVAYLSLTRGEGGQNYIGPEVATDLGILREQELLAARRIDGGRQFFTRAKDFGFSKNAKQTIATWGEQDILRDIVWVIRYFQPDIIINRFAADIPDKHGHHTASAQLSKKAFELAADPQAFPDQLRELQIWQSKRLVWNVYAEAGVKDIGGLVQPRPDYIKINIGQYNSILGKSYAEIAAESRNQHRCQAMGANPIAGEIDEYFKHVAGDSARDNLFEGTQIDWKRVAKSQKIERQIQQLIKQYNPKSQEYIITKLSLLLRQVRLLDNSNWKKEKEEDIKQLIVQALGLKIMVSANKAILSPGEKTVLTFAISNRSPVALNLKKITSDQFDIKESTINFQQELAAKEHIQFNLDANVADSTRCNLPQWLSNQGSKGQYTISNSPSVCLANNEAPSRLHVAIDVLGQTIDIMAPINYSSEDPISGKKYQPISFGPPVSIAFSNTSLLVPEHKNQEVSLRLTAIQDQAEGELSLDIPEKWEVYPSITSFKFTKAGQVQDFVFTLHLPEGNEEAEVSAKVRIKERNYNQSHKKIKYPHIVAQEYFPEAKIKIVQAKLENKAQHIAYIKGTKDEIDKALLQIVPQIDLLEISEITLEKLKKYDAIVLGLRVYNIDTKLNNYQEILKQYVEDGGVVISQYNTNYDLADNTVGIYPLAVSAQRICDEQSPISFLTPDSPLLNYPNQITEADFQGWVQERALFIPQKWNPLFIPILSSKDPNEEAQHGSLLLRPQGKGYYIYCSLALHRQLPAGVPGAYRLFANMLSIGLQ